MLLASDQNWSADLVLICEGSERKPVFEISLSERLGSFGFGRAIQNSTLGLTTSLQIPLLDLIIILHHVFSCACACFQIPRISSHTHHTRMASLRCADECEF